MLRGLKTNTKEMSPHRSLSSSPFPSCFRPSSPDLLPHNHPPPAPPTSGKLNITTCLYTTDLGLFSLTWSRSFMGHSLHLLLHPVDHNISPISLTDPPSMSTISFDLHIKPFTFWKKQGSKKLHLLKQSGVNSAKPPKVQIFWDLSRAKFGSRSEPQSGFYIAVVLDREIVLLVGDLTREACAAKIKALKPERRNQALLLRREHVFGNRVYKTNVNFGGKNRVISIDCSLSNDARLCFSVDDKRVMLVKRLKWKFRGNVKIEVDGVAIHVSWDVYNWMFKDVSNGHAVFMFRFEEEEKAGQEQQGEEGNREEKQFGQETGEDKEKNGVVLCQQNSFGNYGMSGVEWRKMRKSLMMRTAARSSSSSSISMSSASSGCSSSVMEWASTEENELTAPVGFSLLVYAWKK